MRHWLQNSATKFRIRCLVHAKMAADRSIRHGSVAPNDIQSLSGPVVGAQDPAGVTLFRSQLLPQPGPRVFPDVVSRPN